MKFCPSFEFNILCYRHNNQRKQRVRSIEWIDSSPINDLFSIEQFGDASLFRLGNSYIVRIETRRRNAAVMHDDLFLHETNHRHANDFQFVVGLLAWQSRNAPSADAREHLADVTSQVRAFARARAAFDHRRDYGLADALGEVRESLRAHAELRGVVISMDVAETGWALSPRDSFALTLAVNELVTNALKHAFVERTTGRISVRVREGSEAALVIVVDDDGRSMPPGTGTRGDGMGFDLVARLVASVGGSLVPPTDGSKRFTILVPRPTP